MRIAMLAPIAWRTPPRNDGPWELVTSMLTDTPIVTTIHGFSSERILPMYREYQDVVHYVAISDADRHPDLRYAATIHHGIPIHDFPFNAKGSDDLLFFGRIHPDKGAAEAIAAARTSGRHLHMYGIVQDTDYYEREVLPADDGGGIRQTIIVVYAIFTSS